MMIKRKVLKKRKIKRIKGSGSKDPEKFSIILYSQLNQYVYCPDIEMVRFQVTFIFDYF